MSKLGENISHVRLAFSWNINVVCVVDTAVVVIAACEQAPRWGK